MPPPINATFSLRQKQARLLLAIAIIAASLYVLWGFLGALTWAVIFAICSWPLYRRLQKLGKAESNWNCTILPTLATAVVSLVLVAPLCFIALKAAQEAVASVPYLLDVLKQGLPVPGWVHNLPVVGEDVTRWWTDNLESQKALTHFLTGSIAQYGGSSLLNGGRSVLNWFVEFSFATTALYFVYRYGDLLADETQALVTRLFGAQGQLLSRQIVESVYGTLMGLVLVGLGEGAAIGVLYMIAGAPQPLALAFLTGIGSMIPFVGTAVLAVCCLIISFKSLMWGVGVFIGGYTIMWIAGQFIRPALVGGRTNLPFLWAFLGILGGISCFGLLGLFVGPAIMACMITLWRSWIASVQPKPATALAEAAREQQQSVDRLEGASAPTTPGAA
ncbi:AI-2E family transporter [Formicincola oecophyllae]|uniref:AI-2E family transporter n=1 Tax=Formicincola oecophyllae TaxID=2558361 RepID=A0A4Y6U9T3_9PROT|nr:AI-2E family transporter [Formicincola oecophyllae]QDH14229.1 AI-2E family transporter [Formicincola oecophyllae]